MNSNAGFLACWLLLLASGINGITWTDNVNETITTCADEEVEIPLTYDIGDAFVTGSQWFFKTNHGTEQELTLDRAADFVFNNTGSLTIKAPKLTDTGNYTFILKYVDQNNAEVSARTIGVIVSGEAPELNGSKTLTAKIEKAVKYKAGNISQWRIQLSCGRFKTRGYPSVSVVWTTPSEDIVASTQYEDGSFYLLPERVENGTYKCQISDNAALACLENSTLTDAASVEVDNVNVRLLLLEAETTDLKTAVASLTDTVANLNADARLKETIADLYVKLNATVAALQATDRDVKASDDELKATDNDLKNTDAGLKKTDADLQATDAKLTATVTDLSNRISEMSSSNCSADSSSSSGVKTITVGPRLIRVYCDQQTDDGGWTVIQRRQDGSVDFYRDWVDYQMGFGDVDGEFWLGLINIHMMTSSADYTLRVDLWDFNGRHAYAKYETFYTEGADDNYRLHVSGYTGDAGDSLIRHSNDAFSTEDRDNDALIGYNCAADRRGGWWYDDCTDSNLNGLYDKTPAKGWEYVVWSTWTSHSTLKKTEMKIRPRV